MERNHICKKCGGIAGWDSYFQSWICTRCGNEEPKPITNADRIRAMTNEELADFITDDMCGLICGDPLACEGNCKQKMLDWLREEAKEADPDWSKDDE